MVDNIRHKAMISASMVVEEYDQLDIWYKYRVVDWLHHREDVSFRLIVK